MPTSLRLVLTVAGVFGWTICCGAADDKPSPRQPRLFFGIQDERCRLVHYPDEDRTELFDLRKDPAKDVAADPAYAKTLAEMKASFDRLMKQLFEKAAAARQDASKPGKAGIKTVPVQGTITLNGQPLHGAQIVLVPQDKATRPSVGVTGADGRFKLSTFRANDGAAPGQYRVTISVPPDPKAQSEGKDEKQSPRPRVPARYQHPETSSLTVQVGEGPNVFHIDLRD